MILIEQIIPRGLARPWVSYTPSLCYTCVCMVSICKIGNRGDGQRITALSRVSVRMKGGVKKYHICSVISENGLMISRKVARNKSRTIPPLYGFRTKTIYIKRRRSRGIGIGNLNPYLHTRSINQDGR